MKFLVAILLFMCSLNTGLAETRNAEDHFFDMKLGDFKDELRNARKEGKSGILIMFEQVDCPFCFRMKNTILNQSEVQEYYHQHFLIFPVDIRGSLPMQDFKGKETTEKAFSMEHRVYGTPVFDFFDLDGNLVTRFPGTAKDVNEFLLLGQCVAEGACNKMSFSAYKKQQGK